MLQSQRNKRHGRTIRIHDLEQGVPMFGLGTIEEEYDPNEQDPPEQLPLDHEAEERPKAAKRLRSTEIVRTDAIEQDNQGSPIPLSKQIKTNSEGLKRKVEESEPKTKKKQGWSHVPRDETSDAHGRQPAGPLPPELRLYEKFTIDLQSPAKEEKMNYARIRTADIWKTYVKDAEREDKEAMGLWMNNMDNLLVFAGLFSAILTAFLVLSSANLKPDPLDTIASQLIRLTIVTSSPGTLLDMTPDIPFIPSARAVRVNFLWFISLSFAILAAAGAMLANSWCLEYSHQSSSGSPFEQAQRRQRRYNGLRTWKFQEIVELLPGLLYVSIILFMIGVCDYLVDFHTGLAITMTAIFSCGLWFALFTIASSIVYEHCPFRVPLLEAAKHLLLELSISRHGAAKRFGDWEMSDAPRQTGGRINRTAHATVTTVHRTLRPVLNLVTATNTRLLSYSTACINQVTRGVTNVFNWMRDGPRITGMDFVEEPIDPNDQTVVDSIRWILQSCSESETISAALLLMPDVLRSPRHHFELFRTGASQELLRRCSELRQFDRSTTSGEHKIVALKQAVGLAHLFHRLMRPLESWSASDFTTTIEIMKIGVHIKISLEPESIALSNACLAMVYGVKNLPSSLDKAVEAPMSRSATLEWLCLVRKSIGQLGSQMGLERLNNLAGLNILLDKYRKSVAGSAGDFEVNYVYISAISSYLGYVRTSKTLTSPSYRECLYFCVEEFASRWQEVHDLEFIQAAGFVAAIASREVWGAKYEDGISQTQLGASFRRLKDVMTASWANNTMHRFAAIAIANRYGLHEFRPPNPSFLVSLTLHICSKRLGDPNQCDSRSEKELEFALSPLSDLCSIISGYDLERFLPRCRHLLAQLMAVLKRRDSASQSMKKLVRLFMYESKLVESDWLGLGSTVLLEQLVVAGFPDIMRPLLENELRAGSDTLPEPMTNSLLIDPLPTPPSAIHPSPVT